MRASAAPDQFGETDVCRGADQDPDLTGPSEAGKFCQVAPDRGREAEGGARLILENSTVC